MHGLYLFTNMDKTVSHNRSNTPYRPCQNLMDTHACVQTHLQSMVCKIFYFYIQRNSLIAIKSFNQSHQSRECVLAKAPERNATHFHSVSCAEWAQIHSCMCETPYHFCCHHSSQCTGCLCPYSTVSSFCWDVSCLYSDDLKWPAVLPFLSSQWWKTIESR